MSNESRLSHSYAQEFFLLESRLESLLYSLENDDIGVRKPSDWEDMIYSLLEADIERIRQELIEYVSHFPFPRNLNTCKDLVTSCHDWIDRIYDLKVYRVILAHFNNNKLGSEEIEIDTNDPDFTLIYPDDCDEDQNIKTSIEFLQMPVHPNGPIHSVDPYWFKRINHNPNGRLLIAIEKLKTFVIRCFGVTKEVKRIVESKIKESEALNSSYAHYEGAFFNNISAKILYMDHLGMLNHLKSLGLSERQFSRLISHVIDANSETIRSSMASLIKGKKTKFKSKTKRNIQRINELLEGENLSHLSI